MENEVDAKKAFLGLSYYRIQNQPLYLEWAPFDVFNENHASRTCVGRSEDDGQSSNESANVEKEINENGDKKEASSDHNQDGRTKILVRNVPFQASPKEIRQLFSTFGEIRIIRMPLKVILIFHHYAPIHLF